MSAQIAPLLLPGYGGVKITLSDNYCSQILFQSFVKAFSLVIPLVEARPLRKCASRARRTCLEIYWDYSSAQATALFYDLDHLWPCPKLELSIKSCACATAAANARCMNTRIFCPPMTLPLLRKESSRHRAVMRGGMVGFVGVSTQYRI